MGGSVAERHAGLRHRRAQVRIAVVMLSGNSLRQTVHNHCASVHQAAKLVAALLRVAGVTVGLAESNGSLPPGLWLTSPAGWLPRTGISSGTLRSVIEYELPLPLAIITQPFNGPFSRTTWVSRYQKGKTNLDFSEARDGEWQWHQLGHMQVCTLLQTDKNASTPPLSFLQAGCPSCRPTNSVKALKLSSLSSYYLFKHNNK